MNHRICVASSVLALLLGTCSRAAAPGGQVVSLVPAPGSPLPINAYAVAIADVNSDHHQDLIVTAEHLRVFLGDGSGRSWAM